MEWRKIQIHPEIPPQRIPAERLHPEVRHYLHAVLLHVQRLAEPDMEFRQRRLFANSGLAIVGGHYAQEERCLEPYMRVVFRSFFTEGLNIGDPAVLVELATSVGLDGEAFGQALKEERFHRRAWRHQRQVAEDGITGVPTFFVGGQRIVGAQSYEVLHQAAQLAMAHEA